MLRARQAACFDRRTVALPLGRALGAYLAEQLSRPGVETALVEQLSDDRELVLGSRFSSAWTDTTLVIFGYHPVARFTDPQADAVHAEAVTQRVTEAAPGCRSSAAADRTLSRYWARPTTPN